MAFDGGGWGISSLLDAVDSHVPGGAGKIGAGGSELQSDTSRRISKRSQSCDDDMSDDDDGKPRMPVAPPLRSPAVNLPAPTSCNDDLSEDDDDEKPLLSVAPSLAPSATAVPAPRVATFAAPSPSPRKVPGTAATFAQSAERSGVSPFSRPTSSAVAPSRTALAVAAGNAKREAGLTDPASPKKKKARTPGFVIQPATTLAPTAAPAVAAPAAPALAANPPVQGMEQQADGSEKLSLPARIAECQARITELQQQKALVLSQENYIEAHNLKEKIAEQEKLSLSLRRQLDSMPTPARRASVAASRVSVSSGKAGKSPGRTRAACSGGRSPASMAPTANAFSRPIGLTAALNRMASRQGAPPLTSSSLSERPPVPPFAGGGVATSSAAEDSRDVRNFSNPQVSDDKGPTDAAMNAEPDEEAAEDCGEAESSAEDEGANDAETLEVEGQWRTSSTLPGHVELPREQDAKTGELPFALHRGTFNNLYPYQRAGVAWMARLWQAGQGGILADEMGLGKTVQLCALLNGARKAGATHALLLLPVSLLDQWARESRKWCPGWPVCLYYGQPNERKRALRRISRPQGGILLTSYQTLANCEELFDIDVDDAPSPARRKRKDVVKQAKRRRLGDDDEAEEFEDSADEEPCEPEMPGGGLPQLGSKKAWDIIICDEAHRLKNMSSLQGKTIRQVRSHCRILLSGTPVQNALQDLWSLMDVAQPGLLGNHATFVKHFSDPIDRGSFGDATPFQIELKKHLSEQLRALCTPHLLRRTKVNAGLLAEDGVAEDTMGADGADEDGEAPRLAPKRETIIWLAPSADQLKLYKKILERSDVVRQACETAKLGLEVFRAIGLLKRLCNHPALLLPMPKPAIWAEYLSDATSQLEDAPADLEDASAEAVNEAIVPTDAGPETLKEVGVPDDAQADEEVEALLQAMPRSGQDILTQSSKLQCLSSLVPALVERGHRVLIFSQSVKMLDLVQICCLKPQGLRCLRIDGSTDAASRAMKVNKFQRQKDRFQCMLLSTSVGGVGLNLTSADRVILVDPAWNPAVDAQAVDRAFRIGQTKEVRVYRLICSGLIEDKMFRLQVFKMGLSKTALETSDKQQRYFSAREIKSLFEWTDPSIGETRKMLLDKHGDSSDSVTMEAANEDGADGGSGWSDRQEIVGLSDFALLYGSFAEEEERDDVCTTQVVEAKAKLGAADEKLNQKADNKKLAEEALEQQGKDLQKVNKALEGMRERLGKVVDAVKDSQRELTQARRSEKDAQVRLEKANRALVGAEDQYVKTKQAVKETDAAAEAAVKSATGGCGEVRSAEDALTKAFGDARAQLDIVDNMGFAVKDGVVEAATVSKLRVLQKAVERVAAQLENSSGRQVELEFAEQELSKADAGLAEAELALAKLGDVSEQDFARKTAELNAKKFKQERQKAEAALEKVQQKADSLRDSTTNTMQACVEAGIGFAQSLQKSKDRPVKADQVKAVQSTVQAAFRQLGRTLPILHRARDIYKKSLASQRKASRKAAEAAANFAEAEGELESSRKEHQKAEEEEKQYREERAGKEQALARQEATRTRMEEEDAGMRKRKEELKASGPGLKEALKAAKVAEKEANSQRKELHSACSTVLSAQEQMERAKSSAMDMLQSEAYDATQAEKAYESKNG